MGGVEGSQGLNSCPDIIPCMCCFPEEDDPCARIHPSQNLDVSGGRNPSSRVSVQLFQADVSLVCFPFKKYQLAQHLGCSVRKTAHPLRWTFKVEVLSPHG